METKITSLDQLEVGDQLLIDAPLTGENTHCSVISKIPELKYPITTEDGRKCRSLGYDQEEGYKMDFADENNETGDEKIFAVDIVTVEEGLGGSFHFKEGDDIEQWDVRKISEDHPTYSKKITKNVEKFSKMMDDMFSFFGDAEETGNVEGVEKMFGDLKKLEEKGDEETD